MPDCLLLSPGIFIVVTDKVQRKALGELFRRGHAIYKTLPDGVYGIKHSDMKQECYMERFELSIGITLCKPSQAKSAASGTLWVLRNSVTT